MAKKNIYIKEHTNVFYFIEIFFFFLSIHLPIFQNTINKSNGSYITLKIYGSGNKKIINENWFGGNKPDKIYIDNEEKEEITYIYDLNPENIVKLVWEKEITDCEGMFDSCNEIIEINLNHFDASLVKNMRSIFHYCTNLLSIDVSNLDTSNVKNFGNMFKNCYSLISVDVSYFNTSKAENIGTMFYNCRSLKSLNISNFDTSKVKYFDNLFNGCSNLTSINLSNFVTSSAIKMEKMFMGCISLTSINISNFDTSLVTKINDMFNGCESLISLDFSNINLSSIKNIDDMNKMFDNCKNLEYVNIKNYQPSNNFESYYLFSDSPKNLVVCTKDETLVNIIKAHEYNVVNCEDDWYNYRNIIDNENNCIESCTKTSYKYEYRKKCYQSCLNRTYNNNYICEDCHPDCKECEGPFTINNSNCLSCLSQDKYLYFGNCISKCPRNAYYLNETINQKICECELEQCRICSLESLNKNLCISCNTENGYYPIYDNFNINNNNRYLNCSKSPEGYYFDDESSVYKLCYSTCKSCNKPGTETKHNCTECKINYQLEINYDAYKNCYDNCSYYKYFDKVKSKYYCSINLECPSNYNKLIEEKRECVSNCTENEYYKYEFRKRCYKDCPINSLFRGNNTELDYFSLDINYLCKPICNKTNPFELIYTQECVENCPIINIIDKTCIFNYPSIIKEDKENKTHEEIIAKACNIMLKNIEKDMTSNSFNTSCLENGIHYVVEFEQMTVTLTTVANQSRGKNNTNVTIINLGECETLLRESYNITTEEILFMKKIEVNKTRRDENIKNRI